MTTTAHSVPADPPIDHGYFGPESLSWRIFLHPATQLMITQLTNVLELPHIVFQQVLADHDPVYGGPSRSRRRHSDAPVTYFERAQRTVSVPAPILFGTTAEADKASRQLFNYHRPMHGTLADTGEGYAATDADSMLFAAVTIAHAAWLAYENFAYVDGRKVEPLTDDQVRQYLAETAQLGVLMGAPREQYPATREELETYYDSVEHMFRTKPGWASDQLRAASGLMRLGHGRRPRHVAIDVVMILSEVMGFAAIPARFRRLNGIPKALDPALQGMYVCSQPLFRRLAADPRWTGWVYDTYRRGDPETARLLDSAKALQQD